MKIYQFNWGIQEFLYLQEDENSDTIIPIFDNKKKESLSKLKNKKSLKFIDSITIDELMKAKFNSPYFL